jgi:Uma2 family endonuclease
MSAIMEKTSPNAPATPGEFGPRRMTYDEFLAWEHPGIAEWVDGEVSLMSVTLEHQRIVEFLSRFMGLFVQILRLGEVHTAPFVMRAAPGGSGREPDLAFVSTEHRERVTSRQLTGPADLVIEVISEESVSRDRSDKFDEYQDAGVREYWVIDSRPNRRRADFYFLDDTGRYRPVPIADDGTYHSAMLPGFWLNVEWLWAEDPDALTALAQVIGPDRLIEAVQAKSRM